MDKETYCLGENTGCDHEDNPTIEECSDCPYMTTIKPKPPLLDEIDIRKALKDAHKFYVSTKNEDERGRVLKNIRDIELDFIAQAQREADIKFYRGE